MGEIKRIGILTSGGDAPGMNAALRALVRSGLKAGFTMLGIERGYAGLLKGEIRQLNTRSVSEILHAGGTFLLTARSKEFTTPEGLDRAVSIIHEYGIDALVVIGGDGSFRGAVSLAEKGIPVIGIPATIDNDVASTSYAIGFDTALETALDAIDKIRDTSSSHERGSVIEVMGRDAGYIAYAVGLASGAEVTLVPEVPFDLEKDVLDVIRRGRDIGKHHYIVVMAEGCGSAIEMAEKIEEATGIVTRGTVLGYVQRGGRPTAIDRVMASNMGLHAINLLQKGVVNRLVAVRDGRITDVDAFEGVNMKKTIPEELLTEAMKLF
ncbi:MAG: 6-phosphofructokinase [Lachnospiraceae bacterium]|nr:6-phosphofructokinase [Lachnospiraceae bacterium]MBR6349749.1 6-phosphofructokinase [Lachnospiraceae bacterium]